MQRQFRVKTKKAMKYQKIWGLPYNSNGFTWTCTCALLVRHEYV